MKRRYLLKSCMLTIFLPILLSIITLNSAFALPGMERVKSSVRAKKINAAILVNGKVTDETGAPLPGVTVTVKGTTNVTATDVNGAYHINVPNQNTVLVFTFIGYASQEVEINGKVV